MVRDKVVVLRVSEFKKIFFILNIGYVWIYWGKLVRGGIENRENCD